MGMGMVLKARMKSCVESRRKVEQVSVRMKKRLGKVGVRKK